MATAIDRFLDLTLRSSLVTSSQLVNACQGFSITRDDARALNDLCQHLTERGLLTDWQCKKLLSGKWKGIFLDDYCLLGHLSTDETTSTYLCREMTTGRLVAAVITPPHFAPDGKFCYNVRELTDDEQSRFG